MENSQIFKDVENVLSQFPLEYRKNYYINKNSLEISEIMIERVKTTFKLNALDLNNYEIRYHNCIGNPHNETFYEIMVVDGDGNVLELFGEAIN